MNIVDRAGVRLIKKKETWRKGQESWDRRFGVSLGVVGGGCTKKWVEMYVSLETGGRAEA